RHSSLAEYIIYQVSDGKTFRLAQSGEQATTSYAEWSPTGHSVLYVRANDLYVRDTLRDETRVTFDGSATVFNAIPDWIYEEEVFSTDHVCWWSPNSRRIAYLRLDETKVPEYRMTMYAEQPPERTAYPTETKIRYPKPGYQNPVASLHVFSLDRIEPTPQSPVMAVHFEPDRDFSDADRLLVEVAWMGDKNLMVRAMNRVQDVSRLHLVDPGMGYAKFVREESGKLDDGWLDIHKALKYVPARAGQKEGYIDLVPNAGFDHLAFYSPLNAEIPSLWLTSGDWEVVDGPAALDLARGTVYYLSTERGSTQRHIYSVQLDGTGKRVLTPDDDGLYSASFSPSAGWYLQSYKGPNLPHQELRSTSDPKFSRVINDFSDLRKQADKYKLPTIRYTTVKSDGYELNAMETLPPDFDPKKKYGVLFRVYGGPGAQLVTRDYRYGFEAAVASDPQQQMISVTVDGRGTGFKGRPFRVVVRKRLGQLEAIDQINAARHWSTLPYVDPSRLVIWGWSYGGYMAAKVIEANSGVFSGGMSVAPVTNWRFYDSIYTERYMLTPQMNSAGYEKEAIRNPEGFRKARYLVVHGTGDDNVHFQQTAVLVNMLTENTVDPANYEVQFYTDNDHSMARHNAYYSIWKK
ncbi:dipeptidyl peptidase IV N-terminal region-domain-containing protein, partial [Thamnocephalis sphaerospora]